MKLTLDLARKICTSYIINTKHHPEYTEVLKWWATSCDRNHKVAKCMEAIDELKKIL